MKNVLYINEKLSFRKIKNSTIFCGTWHEKFDKEWTTDNTGTNIFKINFMVRILFIIGFGKIN